MTTLATYEFASPDDSSPSLQKKLRNFIIATTVVPLISVPIGSYLLLGTEMNLDSTFFIGFGMFFTFVDLLIVCYGVYWFFMAFYYQKLIENYQARSLVIFPIIAFLSIFLTTILRIEETPDSVEVFVIILSAFSAFFGIFGSMILERALAFKSDLGKTYGIGLIVSACVFLAIASSLGVSQICTLVPTFLDYFLAVSFLPFCILFFVAIRAIFFFDVSV
jgi:hypothetical protein